MEQGQKRQAIYYGQHTRVVSLPGGRWQAQYHGGGAGSRTFDPWRPLARPTESLDLAIQQAKANAK